MGELWQARDRTIKGPGHQAADEKVSTDSRYWSLLQEAPPAGLQTPQHRTDGLRRNAVLEFNGTGNRICQRVSMAKIRVFSVMGRFVPQSVVDQDTAEGVAYAAVLFPKQLPLQTRYLNMLLMTTNSFYGWNQSSYQTLRSLMLIKIAYALEMYHSEHGHYPRALAALSPAFFALPPVDPITGKPPFYVRSTKGYGLTLYKWMLHSKRVEVPFLGPQCIIMPPPPPRSWQTYKFP